MRVRARARVCVQATIIIALDTMEAGAAHDAILAMSTIARVLKDILSAPTNEKFRSLKFANPKLQTKLWCVDGTCELLLACGFTRGVYLPAQAGRYATVGKVQEIYLRSTWPDIAGRHSLLVNRNNTQTQGMYILCTRHTTTAC